MKPIVALLAVVLMSNTVFAADSEVEQLRAEVQALRQMVIQLTERMNKIDGGSAIQQPSLNQAQKPKGDLVEFDYEVVRVLPKVRVVGQHSYEIKKVTARKLTYEKGWEISFEVLYQNRANDKWNTSDEKCVLKLDDVDVIGQGQRDFDISKNQRLPNTIRFRVADIENNIETALVIDSSSNSSHAEIKIILKQDSNSLKYKTNTTKAKSTIRGF